MDVIINAQEGIVCNPSRDILNLLPRVVVSIAHAFDHMYWPELWDILRKLYQSEFPEIASLADLDELIESDLLKAAEAFVALARTSTTGTTPDETFRQAEERSGWSRTPHLARFGFMCMLGVVMTALYWKSCRWIYPVNEPVPGIMSRLENIIAEAHEGRRLVLHTSVVTDIRADLKRLARLALREGISAEEIRNLVEGAST